MGLGENPGENRVASAAVCLSVCPCGASVLLPGVIVLCNCFWTVFSQQSGAEATLQAGLTLLWGVISAWLQRQVGWVGDGVGSSGVGAVAVLDSRSWEGGST